MQTLFTNAPKLAFIELPCYSKYINTNFRMQAFLKGCNHCFLKAYVASLLLILKAIYYQAHVLLPGRPIRFLPRAFFSGGKPVQINLFLEGFALFSVLITSRASRLSISLRAF
jgi:hypothetical protein